MPEAGATVHVSGKHHRHESYARTVMGAIISLELQTAQIRSVYVYFRPRAKYSIYILRAPGMALI